MQKAQQKANANEAKDEARGPIIVGAGGGSGPKGEVVVEPRSHQKPPQLPEDCAATMTADYTYDIALGGY